MHTVVWHSIQDYVHRQHLPQNPEIDNSIHTPHPHYIFASLLHTPLTINSSIKSTAHTISKSTIHTSILGLPASFSFTYTHTKMHAQSVCLSVSHTDTQTHINNNEGFSSKILYILFWKTIIWRSVFLKYWRVKCYLKNKLITKIVISVFIICFHFQTCSSNEWMAHFQWIYILEKNSSYPVVHIHIQV